MTKRNFKSRRVITHELRTPEGIKRIQEYETEPLREAVMLECSATDEEWAEFEKSEEYANHSIFEGVLRLPVEDGSGISIREMRFTMTGVSDISEAWIRHDEFAINMLNELKRPKLTTHVSGTIDYPRYSG